jgi:hypothetical protein
MNRQYDDYCDFLSYRTENLALKMFVESLLQAHPDRQEALERLAHQLESTEGLALFHALPDDEIAGFRAAGERLLSELRHAPS